MTRREANVCRRSWSRKSSICAALVASGNVFSAHRRSTVPALFGNTRASVAVYDGSNPRPAAAFVEMAGPTERPEAVAEFVPALPQVLPLVAAENELASATTTTAAPAPTAADEGVSPWVWALAVTGAVAGASWALHRYRRKPALQPDDREWRTYLLGLDFHRM